MIRKQGGRMSRIYGRVKPNTQFSTLGHAYRITKNPIGNNVIQIAMNPKDAGDYDEEKLLANGLFEDAPLYKYLKSNDSYFHEDFIDHTQFFRLINSDSNNAPEIRKQVSEIFFFEPDWIWVNGKLDERCSASITKLDRGDNSYARPLLLLEQEAWERYNI